MHEVPQEVMLMQALTSFMNNPVGRLLRIALGVAIIVFAFATLEGNARWIVGAVGVVPILLGASGRCLVELIPGARRA